MVSGIVARLQLIALFVAYGALSAICGALAAACRPRMPSIRLSRTIVEAIFTTSEIELWRLFVASIVFIRNGLCRQDAICFCLSSALQIHNICNRLPARLPDSATIRSDVL